MANPSSGRIVYGVRWRVRPEIVIVRADSLTLKGHGTDGP